MSYHLKKINNCKNRERIVVRKALFAQKLEGGNRSFPPRTLCIQIVIIQAE